MNATGGRRSMVVMGAQIKIGVNCEIGAEGLRFNAVTQTESEAIGHQALLGLSDG